MAYRFGHMAQQQYGSQSEYGKGLSADQKAETFQKLTGNDLNLFDDDVAKMFSGGFGKRGKDYTDYRNLFEPVKTRGSKMGRETGEYKLKDKVSRLANSVKLGMASRFEGRADALKEKLINKAYDKALNDAYEVGDVPPEKAAELGEAGYGMKWEYRTNRITGETEIIRDKDEPRESNFWRRNKDTAITAGGGIVGGIIGSVVPGIGTVYGAQAGAALAKSTRDAYKAREDTRKVKDWMRDWENDPNNKPWEPTPGHLYQSAGEGVVEYDTKDIEKKGKKAYVKESGK